MCWPPAATTPSPPSPVMDAGPMTWSPYSRRGHGGGSQPASARTAEANTAGRVSRSGSAGHQGVGTLLARRSINHPDQVAYFVCHGPRRSSLADLTWIAGARWRIEECFQQAKNEAGLDHYQIRTWRAWYAHITLSVLAHAWLAASRHLAAKDIPGA
jgi:SRSO17 transposase